MCFEVLIETRRLSLNLLSTDRTDRHTLMQALHDEGLSDAQIAARLNALGVRTPRGRAYYAELVFVTRRKARLRMARKDDTTSHMRGLRFYLRQKNNLQGKK